MTVTTGGTFISVPFDVDPEVLEDGAVEALRVAIPGWEPADASLEVILIQAIALMNATTTAVAAEAPTAIFRKFGQQILGVLPVAGAAATVTTSWTARDTAGYTAPAGTLVGYRVTGDDLRTFQTTAPVVIPNGSASVSAVTLTALDVGVINNGVPSAAALELVDALSWVSSVVTSSVSAGGVDAETDSAYLDRLAAELRLMAPRPVLPDDFAVLAQQIVGCYRALAINGYNPGTDEVQQVAITGSPAGGTFTLTYSGQTTAAIAHSATAGVVQSALEALSNIGVGDVAATGGPLPATPVLVEFTGALAVTNVAAMTHTDSLTGGSSPAVVITTPTQGVAPSSGNERYVCLVPVDAAGAAVSSVVRAGVVSYLDALREVSFIVAATVPNYTTVNVVYTVHVASGYTSSDVLARATAAVQAFLSPATWAGGGASPPVWRSGETVVRFGALMAALYAVAGVAYVASLTINGSAADLTLTGVAPLPSVGTVTGTAV